MIVSLGYYKNPLCEVKLKKGSEERSALAATIGHTILAISWDAGLLPFGNEDIKQNAKPAWFSPPDFAEVRSVCAPHSEGTQWHQDGDTTLPPDEMDFGLVLWAHRDPTEIRLYHPVSREFHHGQIIQPEPYQIVYVDNLSCYHRRPPGLTGRRWHFRQRVQKKVFA